MPGFGQLLNGKYLKGVTFIALEFLINVQAHLNLSIVYSFKGQMLQAIQVTNYLWLMFYPCVYIFAMWDSYLDAIKQSGTEMSRFISVPFVVAAYITTIGVIYSDQEILGIVFGPVFLPILAMVVGFLLGIVVKKLLVNRYSEAKI